LARSGLLVFLSSEPQSEDLVRKYFFANHKIEEVIREKAFEKPLKTAMAMVNTLDELSKAGLIQKTKQGSFGRRTAYYALTEAGAQKQQEVLAQAEPAHLDKAPSRPPPVLQADT
jgi:hypothetical protein